MEDRSIRMMQLQAHGKFWAILHLRCPRCHHGRVYNASTFAMNRECTVCFLGFEREPGYFSGALYFSFLLGVGLVVLFLITLLTFFPGWPDLWTHGLALVLMLPFLPFIMRYARVLWMTMDRSIDLTP